jgi:hypothetical protein
MGEVDRDFGRCRAVMIQGGGNRRFGALMRKDLRGKTGTLHPVDIFAQTSPCRRLLQARNGTFWRWA